MQEKHINTLDYIEKILFKTSKNSLALLRSMRRLSKEDKAFEKSLTRWVSRGTLDYLMLISDRFLGHNSDFSDKKVWLGKLNEIQGAKTFLLEEVDNT
jgi:hypothetical protein